MLTYGHCAQAHEDAHLAEKLQQKENELGRLLAFAKASSCGTDSSSKRAGSGSSTGKKKRASSSKASSSKQVMLTAFKRPKT
jgi:hypothetical protein